VDVPLIVQDASGYVGRPLSIGLQARLHGELGDRAMFKPEAPPIGPQLTRLLSATGGRPVADVLDAPGREEVGRLADLLRVAVRTPDPG
jgi:hypothetical protein